MKDLLSIVQFIQQQISKPGRELVLFGELDVLDSVNLLKKSRLIILFNDVLIISSRKYSNNTTKNIKWRLNLDSLCLRDSFENLKTKQSEELNSFTVVYTSVLPNYPFLFETVFLFTENTNSNYKCETWLSKQKRKLSCCFSSLNPFFENTEIDKIKPLLNSSQSTKNKIVLNPVNYLDEKNWNTLQNAAEIVFHSKGNVIIDEGEPFSNFYRVKKGSVCIEKEGQILETLEEGSIFGEMEILDRKTSAKAIANEDNTEVYKLSEANLNKILQLDSNCSRQFFQMVCMSLACRLYQLPIHQVVAKLNLVEKRDSEHEEMPITSEINTENSHFNAMTVYREAMLKDLFTLREGDSLMKEYECAIKGKLHKINGTLFVFNSGIGFYSRTLKMKENWSDILEIEHNQEKMKLIITTSKKRNIFYFSQSSIETYELILNLYTSTQKFNEMDVSNLRFSVPQDEDWETIFQFAKIQKFSSGEVILKYGQETSAIYQVVEGTCYVEKRNMESRTLLGIMQEGELFGEITHLFGGAVLHYVVAASEVILRSIEKNSLQELFRVKPQLAVKFYKFLSLQISHNLLNGLDGKQKPPVSPVNRCPSNNKNNRKLSPLMKRRSSGSFIHSLLQKKSDINKKQTEQLDDSSSVSSSPSSPLSSISLIVPTLLTNQRSHLYVKVIYPFDAIEDNEISLSIGDIVFVHNSTHKDWWYGEHMNTSQTGFFPASFVEWFQGTGESPDLRFWYLQAVAIADFLKEEPDELSFRKGDVITIYQYSLENEWLQGELNHQVGFFPSSFVQLTRTSQILFHLLDSNDKKSH